MRSSQKFRICYQANSIFPILTTASAKELRLIEYIAKGMSNKEISECLFLSEGTIRNYLSVILEKLETKTGHSLPFFTISINSRLLRETSFKAKLDTSPLG